MNLIAADPNAKIMEKIACRGQKHKSKIINIINEKNQRIFKNQLTSLFDELNNLPWG